MERRSCAKLIRPVVDCEDEETHREGPALKDAIRISEAAMLKGERTYSHAASVYLKDTKQEAHRERLKETESRELSWSAEVRA